MSTMHPSHLINALNRQAKEAAVTATPEQLQLIGELAVTLVQKGCHLEATAPRNQDEFDVLEAYEGSLEQARQTYGACPRCGAPLMPDKWCGNCKATFPF
jgi:hypothetical protein